MFLGKTLYCPHASLHPGVLVGTGELSGKPDEMLGGGAVALDWHPIWGGGAVLLVPSCHGSRDESHLERLLDLSTDLLTPLMMTSAHDYLGCWIRGPFQR